MTITSAQIYKLADAFVEELRNVMRPFEWRAMVETNKSERYVKGGLCASHNYLDANMQMADAFETIFDRSISTEADYDAVNKAWAIARRGALAGVEPDHAGRMAEALAALTSETFDWAWNLCGEREDLDAIRDEAKAALRNYARANKPISVDLDAAIVAAAAEDQIWRAPQKAELAKWYDATIGYDPFADDPTITISEVEKTKAEYLAERAAEKIRAERDQ